MRRFVGVDAVTEKPIDKTIRQGKAVIVYDPWGLGWSKPWAVAQPGWALPGGRWTADATEALRCAQVIDALLTNKKR